MSSVSWLPGKKLFPFHEFNNGKTAKFVYKIRVIEYGSFHSLTRDIY